MDATQMISDSHLESDEEENEEESGNSRGHPLAKLCILKNEHVPEAEFPLFLGDNVLGRDPSTCTLPLLAPSVSKQHVTISLSVYRTRGHQSEVEALVWDHGSLNGTRKGRLKLTSNVRYALSEGDSLVLADIPCRYVTCAADTLSSQSDLRTPMSRNSGVKNKLPDASRENRSDSSIGSKKSINGNTKARVPLPDLEDTRRTPAKTSCLSFEQTPTQPQGTLVPDSDSDSDGERRTGGDRKHKIVVSDSDSYKSSPTCSTFLSPTNKIVPESEDESSITPPSSTKNRPCRHVSFSTEETDMNVARQQLQEKKSLVIMGDSEEEEGSKEERATPGTKPDKSGQPMPVNQESSASLAVGDKLPVFTPAPSTDVIAPFNMDSDTDVEEEEERVAVASVTLNTNKQDDQPPSTVQFNMDSDTDVDEDSEALVSGPKSALLSDDATKPPVHVIRPQGISMDSDTDVDDDGDDNVSEAAKTAKPTLSQAAHTANSALVTQPEDFHLNSDTDVDEDEEKECGTNVICSATSKTSAGLVLQKTGPESTSVTPHSLHPDSDTDDEGMPGPTLNGQLVGSDITHTGAGADLEVLPNRLTDLENDSPLVIPVAITTLSATSAAAAQSDSDADTDVDESSKLPAGNGNNPADLKLNSDMDVEDKEAGGYQIPDLCREQTPLLPVPLLQKCSTPIQQPEAVEELETQPFASPSSGPFRYPPPGRPAAFSLSSDSQGEEDFTVAETQSFILQHRDRQKCSLDDPTQTSGLESSVNKKYGSSSTGRTFQLELSDSSHLQCQAQALAMDSTQPFGVTEDGVVHFEETQPYADIMTADQTSGENKSYLEATQAYGGEVGCTVGTEKELHVDLALQATQAYIPEPYSDAEEETADETQPSGPSTSSTLAMAETQLMPVLGIEHSPTEDDQLSSVPKFATKEKVDQGEGVPREKRQSEVLSIAETQPVSISNYEESEDSLPVLRKRKAKQLRSEEEETQTSVNSDLSIAATQPMCISNYAQSDDEDSLPTLRKRKAKQLRPEEEETQTTVNSDLSVAETQPMCISNYAQSDDEDSLPTLRKRKAKQLRPEEEETQTTVNSDLSIAATQPMCISNYAQSDDEDSLPTLRKRKAKQLRPEEEETQTTVNSDLSVAETQPMCISNYAQSDDEDSLPILQKRKAKQLRPEEEETQTTVNSDLSVAETQPMCINNYEESDDEDSFPGPRKRKAKPLEHKDEDTQSLPNSEVSAIHALPVETKPCVQLQEEQVIQHEAGVSGVNKEDTHRVVNPVAETQPMCSSNNEESDGEDSVPIFRKRKAKQLQPAEEVTQALVTPEPSVVETQPMDTGERGQSDEDSIPGPIKRKAKPLQHKDEDTQPLTNSEASTIDSKPIETKSCEQLQKGKARQSEAGPSGVSEEETHRVLKPVAETQPMCISNYNESNAEASEGEAKNVLAEEEEIQAVVTPELPAAETPPIGTNEDVEGDNEDSVSGPRKRKAKLGSETSARNSQNQTKDSLQCQRNEEMQTEAGTSGVSVRNRRGARAREDEEEQTECSEPPKRQTRGKRNTLPTSRGRKGKSRPEDDESEEEEEAEQATRANSKRYEKGKDKRKLKELERKEREEEEKLKLEEERAEQERLEKEKKKQEEKEIADGIKKEKELLERQGKEKETDREEKERKEMEQKDQEEKDRLEMVMRAKEEQQRLEEKRKEQEHQARLEKERLEKQKLHESHENKDVISEAPDRGRRATRRTAAVSSTTESQQESSNATGDDCPARRTRSRSNSSNSVSSERSASSSNTQESRGRGRGRGKGRGVTRTSELSPKTTARSSNRRRTVATEPSAQRQITEWVSNDIPSPRVLSRSNSSNSLNSEISSCSVNSQSRGRGGRQRGRGRGRGRKTETEPDSVPPISSQSDQRLVSRGRKSRASELPPIQDEITRTNAQQPGTTTRGRGRARVNHSEPAAADEENRSNLEEESASDPSLLPQGNDGVRKQKTETCETVETLKAIPFSDGHDAEEKRRGRKRDLETDAEEGSSCTTSRGKIKVQKADEKTEKQVGTTTGHAKKNANESGEEVERKEDGKKVDEEDDEKKARARPSRVRSKRKEKQEDSGLDTNAEAQQPQTPPSSVSRKRQLASLDSSPVAKTPRSSCASPVTTGRSRAASQGFKVLFTGVVDDAGERVLSRLGGSMAKTMADMNCLVTDKVRRTVKFLCAVAKGVPIVTTQWLEKSGKAGTFLSPSAYVVKDSEQENKFNFCLQESLRIASSQALLQGYEIHVTKSVKPEPVHMKDIISCSGATFLPKMPSSHKPQTVVVSCEEDWPLCGPAVMVSIPVVTAEFILTGILQQKVDFETHKLSGPAATPQPPGGRGRGRKKT